MSNKIRYAVVGTGGRVSMFIDPIARDYPAHCQLTALCDTSLVRAAYHRNRLATDYGYEKVPLYHARDFDRMVKETKPDVVIVCTMDSTHHEYIIKALNLGCDVVTEKPMTTDEVKCRDILKAVEETGHKVRVTFNYRWARGPTKVRELVKAGAIGNIKAAHLEYQLNTSHGADYFRRWHAHKECSGGLWIHKSTHHFDLVNWVIDAIPEEVFAYAALRFYGKANAIARGDEALTKYERYTGASEAKDDPFALTLDEGSLKALYKDAEEETGYLRDRNVFRDGITSADTMAVLVKYRTGVLLNYSLVCYSPEEGYRLALTGDRGRLEYTEMHASHIIRGQSDRELADEQAQGAGNWKQLRVIPMFGRGYEVDIPEAVGSHGGSDPLLQEQIFSPNPPHEIWGRNAGHEQGAASILIGAAANRSSEQNRPVRISDLCAVRPEAKHLSELT